MEKNEKAIYNNWGLMEYLNNIDVNSLNFEIGKYLYENRNNIEKMTVDEIAETQTDMSKIAITPQIIKKMYIE